MNAPKLFFHGTSALSVWVSYRRALNLAENIKRKNPQAERHLDDTCSREIFRQFGPLYPAQDKNEEIRKAHRLVCITHNLSIASTFANKWIIHPNEGDNGLSLKFEGRSGWKFAVVESPELPGSEKISHIMRMLNQIKHDSPTPGAVLVLDGAFLHDEDILRPNIGEEDFVLAFLPWRAIRGVLFLDTSSLHFTGWWPRDAEIVDYLRPHFEYLSKSINIIDDRALRDHQLLQDFMGRYLI